MTQRSKAYFQALFITGYTPTQEDFSDLFESYVNKESDKFTSCAEQTLAISFGSANADGSVSKSFFCDVTENVLVDATGIIAGETYTFMFLQSANNATVTLRGVTFSEQTPFAMVTGDGNRSMVQAYCHLNPADDTLKLWVFPQQDFS